MEIAGMNAFVPCFGGNLWGKRKNIERERGEGMEGRRGAKRSEISGTIGLSSFLVARSTPTRGWQPLNNRRSHVEVRYSYDHREPFSSGDTQLKSLIIHAARSSIIRASDCIQLYSSSAITVSNCASSSSSSSLHPAEQIDYLEENSTNCPIARSKMNCPEPIFEGRGNSLEIGKFADRIRLRSEREGERD